mmetsp:Transcript_88232/g.228886  ORF Transcript_88232/g.228886 Transcript_88232/m.228886 type:complete len:705 (-) Transcript_88232:295-2409(-)
MTSGRDTAQRRQNKQKRPDALHTFRRINSEVIKSSATGDIAKVLAVVGGHLTEMNLVNLTTALHRLAKMTATSKSQLLLKENPTFERLLNSLSLALDALKPDEVAAQSLSNVAWSLATMQLPRADLFSKIVSLAAGDVSSFQPFELANLLWACAKLGASDDRILSMTEPIFQEAETYVVARADPIPFRCLATMLWAFATVKRYHPSFFGFVAEKLLSQVFTANCQELANTTWALGKADFRHEQLCSKLAARALSSLQAFKAQELSNMVWGFSCIGFFHDRFFAEVATALKSMELTTQHIANISAAYVRVAPGHQVTRAVLLNLLPHCCDRVRAFKPQEISAVVLAVSKAFGKDSGYEPCSAALHGTKDSNSFAVPEIVCRFFEVAAPRVMRQLSYFSIQSLTSLAKAFPKRHVSGAQDLVSAVRDEALKRLTRGSSHTELHECLNALSSAEHVPPPAPHEDINEAGHAMGPTLAPRQTLEKQENSRRRRRRARGQACLKAGGPCEAHGEADVCNAFMPVTVATSADLHSQQHHASSSWNQVFAIEWSPYCMLQASVDHPALALVACDGEIETQWPTQWPSHEESAAPSVARRGGSQLCVLGRSVETYSVDADQRSEDLKWNCSVKNSFLHVEVGYDSDCSTDDHSSRDGGASQRSSSVPSRLLYAELEGGWHRRRVETGEEPSYSHRYANDLACLNFAWEMPSK